MTIETPEKPDEKTPDPAAKPEQAAKSWFERNSKVIAFAVGALIVLAALVLGLRHG